MIKSKTIIVLFAPGLGGNHLANMLSTDTRFRQRANVDDYQTKRTNAHYWPIQNLKLEHLCLLDDTESHVLCGHWGEFYWCQLSRALDRFANQQVLVVRLPKKDTVAHQRLNRFNPGMTEYFMEEQRSLYSIDVVERIFGQTDLLDISSECIFDPDIEQIKQFITKETDLTPDWTICERMHKLWYIKMFDHLALI